ncbi:MAG: metal-dependent hydrolase [Phycisphaerae bacterium]|nr:metal-dependent hydrolase [Phycisphaerae bacterium]
MSLKITYLGHSGFLFDDGRFTCAVDPFLTGNPRAIHKPDQIHCTHVALTHGHDDHLGDTVSIARKNRAKCVANWEICSFLGEQGIHSDQLDPGNTGGTIKTDFGWIAFTPAFHSSSTRGRYMGQPCGLVIRIGGINIYHAGDTALFSDMKLIAELYRPQIACLPVGDRFTMGPEHAAKAAEWIQPRFAIPIHYKTFGLLRQDIAGFSPAGVEVKELPVGEAWTVPG